MTAADTKAPTPPKVTRVPSRAEQIGAPPPDKRRGLSLERVGWTIAKVAAGILALAIAVAIWVDEHVSR